MWYNGHMSSARIEPGKSVPVTTWAGQQVTGEADNGDTLTGRVFVSFVLAADPTVVVGHQLSGGVCVQVNPQWEEK